MDLHLLISSTLQACVCILRSSLIFHRVSTAVVLFPGVLAAPLILGTLAGSAGKMLVDALQVSAGISKGIQIIKHKLMLNVCSEILVYAILQSFQYRAVLFSLGV